MGSPRVSFDVRMQPGTEPPSRTIVNLPMATSSQHLIRLDEIDRAFSNSAIASAAKRAGIRLDVAARERFAWAIRTLMHQYAVEVRRSTPNTVRQEIEALAKALDDAKDCPDPCNYNAVAKAWAELSGDARKLLEHQPTPHTLAGAIAA